MSKSLICMGIEGTAHTFGIGIVDSNGVILADERTTYVAGEGKGIIPNEARDYHEKFSKIILEKALENSVLTVDNIDLIAYSAGPGLPPTLIFTADFVKELSEKYKKPLIPVNHSCAHLEIGRLTTEAKDPIYVYLSGGNTQIIAFVGNRYRIFGETLDISVGNCIDTVARSIGLDMPGGPKIEEMSRKGEYIDLPYVVKGMDVSFSGIQTVAINLLKKGVRKEDVAYSLQEICFSMLTEVTERAMAHTGKQEVLLVGGVAANKRLQEMMKKMCEERGAKAYIVPQKYAGDNGVMIGWNGLLMHKSGWKPDFKDKVRPKWRIDEVEITWV